MRHHAAALRPRDSAFMEVGHTWTSARLREMLSHELARSWVFFSASDTNGNGLLDHEFGLRFGMRSDVPDAVCDAVFDEFYADRLVRYRLTSFSAGCCVTCCVERQRAPSSSSRL